jgi:hypothetical protein
MVDKKKAGRKPRNPQAGKMDTRATILLTEDEHKRLLARAQENHWSVSTLIRLSIQEKYPDILEKSK